MTFREIVLNLDGDVCISVSPQFEGDIVVYTAVYALSKMIKGDVKVYWPGHLPPAADRIFPLDIVPTIDKHNCSIVIEPGRVFLDGKVFEYKYSPAELLIDGTDGEEDVLASLFVSLYASTRGFATDDISDEIFDWFERLLESGFPHYRYVDLIYVISSADVFRVWGEVLQKAKLKDDMVVSVYEGQKKLLPPEWFKVASYLSRYTGKGRVYVKKKEGYEYFDSSGDRGSVNSI